MSDFATFNILSWICNLACLCLNLLICKMRMTLALKWSNGHSNFRISCICKYKYLPVLPFLLFFLLLLFSIPLFSSIFSLSSSHPCSFFSPLHFHPLHSISYDVESYNWKFMTFELKYTIFQYKFVLFFSFSLNIVQYICPLLSFSRKISKYY